MGTVIYLQGTCKSKLVYILGSPERDFFFHFNSLRLHVIPFIDTHLNITNKTIGVTRNSR